MRVRVQRQRESSWDKRELLWGKSWPRSICSYHIPATKHRHQQKSIIAPLSSKRDRNSWNHQHGSPWGDKRSKAFHRVGVCMQVECKSKCTHMRVRAHTHTFSLQNQKSCTQSSICLKILHPEAVTAEPWQMLSPFFLWQRPWPSKAHPGWDRGGGDKRDEVSGNPQLPADPGLTRSLYNRKAWKKLERKGNVTDRGLRFLWSPTWSCRSHSDPASVNSTGHLWF